jgi:hypothetical protein
VNRDDILLAMKEVGAAKHDLMPKTYEGVVDVFERFAALVTDAERERACHIVTGLCISDNNAHEINTKIREGNP